MLVAGWTWPPVHVAHVRRLYVDQWVAVMRWPPVAGRRSSGGRSPELRRSPAVCLLLHDPHFLPRFHVRFCVRFHVRWMSLDLKIVAVVASTVSHLSDHSNRPPELRRRCVGFGTTLIFCPFSRAFSRALDVPRSENRCCCSHHSEPLVGPC